AAKYAAAGESPRFDLAVTLERRNALLTARDGGPSIPHAERSRLFRPFHKSAAQAATAGAPGLGLGLALSRALARGFGGDLSYVGRDGGGRRGELSEHQPLVRQYGIPGVVRREIGDPPAVADLEQVAPFREVEAAAQSPRVPLPRRFARAEEDGSPLPIEELGASRRGLKAERRSVDLRPAAAGEGTIDLARARQPGEDGALAVARQADRPRRRGASERPEAECGGRPREFDREQPPVAPDAPDGIGM